MTLGIFLQTYIVDNSDFLVAAMAGALFLYWILQMQKNNKIKKFLMKTKYKGIIIKESLTDSTVLDSVEVVSKHTETDQDNSNDTWHLYDVRVSREEIEKLQQYLKHDRG